jgi:4-hydroxybenzoate polyprenyltransferase
MNPGKPPPPRHVSTPKPAATAPAKAAARPAVTAKRPLPARPVAAVAPAWSWTEQFKQYALLMRLHRPVGWLLLLWPTWWGLWCAARGLPSWKLLAIFSAGVIVMRSAGCVINDWADRWLDGSVKRTQDRPIAAGKVKPAEALVLFTVLMLIALGLVLLTDPLTIKLAGVGAVLAIVYPFLKRHTHLPQLWLGAAFGWSVPMAYAAQKGEIDTLAWLLFLANVLWSSAYDTIYAMVDRDDDIRMGARSTAILLGDMELVGIGILHASFLFAMWLVGERAALGWPYIAGWCVALGVIAWQHWVIRSRDRDACFLAFRHSHWAGMALFAGIAAAFAFP